MTRPSSIRGDARFVATLALSFCLIVLPAHGNTKGVDTAEKAKFLGQMSCHARQGFYFLRPLAAADLEGFIDHDKILNSASETM